MSRTTQPYRALPGRLQGRALDNILRGRTVGGYNPQDVKRGLQRMARAAKQAKTGRGRRPARPARPQRPPR